MKYISFITLMITPYLYNYLSPIKIQIENGESVTLIPAMLENGVEVFEGEMREKGQQIAFADL